MQTVHDIGAQNRDQLKRVIASAVSVVESFREGTPDRNTLNVLKSALQTLETADAGALP
jgi:hypothetical protein